MILIIHSENEIRIKNHQQWEMNNLLWINNLIKEDSKVKKCDLNKYY
jgi:hypothetical protein